MANSHRSNPPKSQTSFADEIDDAVLQELYAWVDQIPLSRPKKNLTRDFSDGVLVAETIAYYFPKLVEIHNYPPATGTKLKVENWRVLNRKVFKKLHFELADDVIQQIVNCKPFVIERVLLMLRTKVDTILWERQKERDDQPEVDQHKQGGYITEAPSYDGPHDPVTAPPKKGTQMTNRTTGAMQKVSLNDGERQPKVQTAAGVSQQLAGRSIVSNDMVSRMQLEEKIQECLVKEETIQILEAKIRRLEHLLHLKDVRINDLQSRVDGIRPTGAR